ncbi:hypothetical protein AX16_010921 [Volvariella volvacea WC 439]|nr:hypothetical protein AX16_010921 [Volvariella volvacea WC 439]
MMGYHPKAIPEHPEPSYIPDVNKRLRVITEARKKALAAHELARINMTKWNHTNYTPFKKLAPKREGPFKITKVLGPVTFQLELPEQWKIHNVFHASLLTPYKENNIHGPNFLMPPSDIINDEEEWEVENIIKYRWIGPKRKRQVEYLIAWKGYPSSENHWEKEELLANAPDILKRYKKEHNIFTSEASSPSFSSHEPIHHQPRSRRYRRHLDPRLDQGESCQQGPDTQPLRRSTRTRRPPAHRSLHASHVI